MTAALRKNLIGGLAASLALSAAALAAGRSGAAEAAPDPVLSESAALSWRVRE